MQRQKCVSRLRHVRAAGLVCHSKGVSLQRRAVRADMMVTSPLTLSFVSSGRACRLHDAVDEIVSNNLNQAQQTRGQQTCRQTDQAG